jgi:hypothetical protein
MGRQLDQGWRGGAFLFYFYFGSASVGGVLNAVSAQEYFLFKDSEILAKIQE